MDQSPGLRRLKSWIQHPAGVAAMEMCTRLMHESKPSGYRNFPQLLLDTELLDNSWDPVVIDTKNTWIRGWVSRSLDMSTAPVISLHMSLVKMMMLRYSEEAGIHGVSSRCVVATAWVMQDNMVRAIKQFVEYSQEAKQVGSGLSKEAFAKEYFTAFKPSELRLRVPSHDKLLLILVRFWLQLSIATLPQDPANLLPVLSLPVEACAEIAGIATVLRGCGAVLTIGGDVTFMKHPKKLAQIWEQLVSAEMKGRLLPGCCYWGCTNMSGFSEAALSTQLCSRCRRVRYCCEGCQKSAWLEGHKEACASL